VFVLVNIGLLTPTLSSLREEREKKWCVCPDAPQQPVKVVALVGESPTRRIGRFTTERPGAVAPQGGEGK
jgi:hypothetical protein